MKPLQTGVVIFVTILATGALLNVAGSGRLGSSVQRGARFVTEGYGV